MAPGGRSPWPPPGRACGLPIIRRASVLVAVLCLVTLAGSRSSYAVDAVDLAVEAFAAGGAAVGIPISGSEEFRQAAGSMRRRRQARHRLHEREQSLPSFRRNRRNLARCVSSGQNVAQCVQNEAFKRLPAQSQELAKCVAGGTDVTECGKKFATSHAEKAVFGTIDKLKGDAKDKFKEATGPLQNIINVVDGIAREGLGEGHRQWRKAVAKYVVKTVITSLLTPATTYLAGPIIDTLIDNRIDLVTDLIKALPEGDTAAIAGVVAEAYVTSYVENPLLADTCRCGQRSDLPHARQDHRGGRRRGRLHYGCRARRHRRRARLHRHHRSVRRHRVAVQRQGR